MKKLIKSTDRTSALVAALYTVYREYLPPFYFHPFHPGCQQANLKLVEFQCLKLSLLNTSMSGRFQYRTKPFEREEGRK